MMSEIAFIPAVLQGITEALPVSSSLHLRLSGMTNTIFLHFITGISGICYLLLNQTMLIEVIYAKNVLSSYLAQSKAKFPLPAFLLATAVLSLLVIQIKPYFANLVPTLYLSILNSVLVIFCEVMGPNGYGRDLPAKMIYVSVLCNLLAILPGFSRLGTVYAGLRLIGISQSDAIHHSTIQGIFISSFGLLADLLTGKVHSLLSMNWLQFLMSYSVLNACLCGSIYYILVSVLLRLDSRRVRSVILASCNYRLALATVLLFTN